MGTTSLSANGRPQQPIRTPFLTRIWMPPMMSQTIATNQLGVGVLADAIGHLHERIVVRISRWGIYSAWDMMMTVVAGEYKVPRALECHPQQLSFSLQYLVLASPPIYALPQTLISMNEAWSVRHCACDPEWPRFPALSSPSSSLLQGPFYSISSTQAHAVVHY